MKDSVRLNFDFPREHYPYLKMLCAKKGVSLKKLATELLTREIEEYEDRLLAEKAQKRLTEMDMKENIDFNEAIRLAGWTNNGEDL